METDGISREELSAILAEYDAGKKFYRMKNGDFLALGDDGLLTVSRLARSLGVERSWQDRRRSAFPCTAPCSWMECSRRTGA